MNIENIHRPLEGDASTPMLTKTFKSALCFLALLSATVSVQAQNETCGPLTNAYGPFNYRTQYEQIKVVEAFHFNADVANLRRGMTGSMASDLDYTLRASPNHSKALIAMMRLAERQKTEKPVGSSYSVECWFDRSLRFSPNDAIVRMIFADYLGKRNRKAEAIQQLDKVIEQGIDSPLTHYNLGLIFVDLGEFDRALEQAQVAYEMGIQQPTLKARLQAAGKWQETPSQ
ncbi:tetratricopeptide repeat protein [Paucibacter sp. Y2R2-4]|uniref:tetratricopeptide repeat protein n=1 Tax=Paucibacter sp. Y2R2-4 TaxID=2893553 RepID=UPI0021E39FA7|nr:tetratricopeptide repeat protein [Paucibacter sp. Y2R2-4]MCV2348557.1 ABC transporter permease [Paucibacter sp. Y2R2-4]